MGCMLTCAFSINACYADDNVALLLLSQVLQHVITSAPPPPG